MELMNGKNTEMEDMIEFALALFVLCVAGAGILFMLIVG
jgi:hypothetical protein